MPNGMLVAMGVAGVLVLGQAISEAQSAPALTPPQIDHLIRAEWNKEGVAPASRVDDARYLRRIYLDIVGTIPPPDVVRAFLADPSPDKRQRAVLTLLDSPKYADHWTNYWDSVLMGKNFRMRQVDDQAFRGWLHTQFTANAPWNKFVYNLITATGTNSAQGYTIRNVKPKVNPVAPNVAANGSTQTMAATPGGTPAATVTTTPDSVTVSFARAARRRALRRMQQNGQVAGANAPAGTGAAQGRSATGSPDMMMQSGGDMSMQGAGQNRALAGAPLNGATNWVLKYAGNPQDLSGQASKIFLGVQIQCAQCHDHKTEKWKQEDFRRFTACFINTRPRQIAEMTDMGRNVRFDVEDLSRPFVPLRAKKANPNAEYAASPPAALDGTDFSDSPNRRQALAAWMTAPQNPWFAEAFVNRMWAHFLGRGFIEPIDDIRPSNPAVMPELLKRMSDDFVAHDYDVKRLIQTICATQVYQLSAAPPKKVDEGNKFWASFRLKPMGPDEMLDALVAATNMQPVLERIAGAKLDQIKLAMQRQFTFLFDVDEEFEQKDFEGTIPQALMLLNGNLVNRGVTPIPGTALADVLAAPGDDQSKIEALYLRTLSRKPTPAETQRWVEYIHAPRFMTTGSDGGGQATPMNARAENRALQQALRNRKGNNGFDPLARMGNTVKIDRQSPDQQAYEDMFWALLNSSEFIFNH
jgi:hypothetical protein